MQNAESQPQENSGRSPICVTDFKARKRPPKFRFRIQCVAQQNSGDTVKSGLRSAKCRMQTSTAHSQILHASRKNLSWSAQNSGDHEIWTGRLKFDWQISRAESKHSCPQANFPQAKGQNSALRSMSRILVISFQNADSDCKFQNQNPTRSRILETLRYFKGSDTNLSTAITKSELQAEHERRASAAAIQGRGGRCPSKRCRAGRQLRLRT